MPELGPYGSVRGARGNSRPYRESDWQPIKPTQITHKRHGAQRRTRLISAGEQMGLAELQSVVVSLSSLSSRVSKDRRESRSACYRLQKLAA